MKLSFQNRIFIVVGIFAVLALLTVWTIIRPKYEASVITEHMNTIQHLQTYAIEDLDHTITSWSDVTHFIAGQVTEHPKEGEIILHSMIALHPEIIQIKIQSPKLSDELTSQNTSYPLPNLQMNDSLWVRSKIDSMLHVAWLKDTSAHQNFFATQARFQVQNIPFILTVVWDAKKLNTLFAELPLSEGYSASIQSASSVLLQNTSSFKTTEVHSIQDNTDALQSMRQNKSNWIVLTSAFQTVQLWMIIAVPEKTMLKPVGNLLLYSTIFIIGLAFMMFVFGWILTLQIKRPIVRLVKDVQRLSNLDFTQPIQIPAIKDLRNLGEALEQMRQALEQYQHPNNNELHYADGSKGQDESSDTTA
jgi:HAMP domain-containing protein